MPPNGALPGVRRCEPAPDVRVVAAVSVAALLATTLATAAVAGTGASAAVPSVDRAPRLPRVPSVPDGTSARAGPPRSPCPPRPPSAPASGGLDGRRSAARPGRSMSMPPAGGVPLLGDWNGDGVATPGRYEAGQWFITNASVDSPAWEGKTAFGGDPADIPVVGRIDKDRRTDIGVFRDGEWHWQRANGKPSAVDQFGQAGDIPIVGDWDGDGRDDLGVVRGQEWLLRAHRRDEEAARGSGKHVDITMARDVRAAVLQFRFGRTGDVPVVGDWDRDGRDEPGCRAQPRDVGAQRRSGAHPRARRRETHPLAEGEVAARRQPGHSAGPLPDRHEDGRALRRDRREQGRRAEDAAGHDGDPRQCRRPRHGAGQPAVRRHQRPHQAAEVARRPRRTTTR